MKRSATARILIGACVAALMAGAVEARDVVIHAGTLIDGIAQKPRAKMSILIHDDRITGVESGFVNPPNAEIIDLSDKTVLPGFIDAHDHISMGADFSIPFVAFRGGPADAIVTAFKNARRDIEIGFTTIRDVGSGEYEAATLIKAEAAGVAIGPRVWTSLEPLSATGGHSDPLNGVNPEIVFNDRDRAIIDSAEDAKIKVRQHRRDGATVIKIMPSGGVASVGDDPHAMTMTDDEMKSAIDTAHALGLKVAAHAHGKKAIDHVVMAGVDSVEHGTYADAETYKLMKQHGTFMVPTLLVADWIYQAAVKTPQLLPPSVPEKAIAVTPTMMGNAGNAYRAGVKVALGTDISGMIRNKAEEFALMVKAGLPPMESIFAGTRNAAELIGSKDIGGIQTGRYADIVAVTGDPIADIAVLQKVDFVMKGGETLKRDGKMLR